MQKLLVDHVKVVIKGKKVPADQKVRALKLLNKAVMASDTNAEFISYVQKKILDRLQIFAQFVPSGGQTNVTSLASLKTRG